VSPKGLLLRLSVPLLCLSAEAFAAELVLGSIGRSPSDEIRDLKPIADYLTTELKGDGVDRVTVVVAPSIAVMAAYMKEGKVDLFIDSPIAAAAVSEFSGSRFLLRRWKRGNAEYRGTIFVRKDSGMSRLEDLKGKMIAFEEPFSTSGHFLPRIALLRTGLPVTPKEDPSQPVGKDEIGAVFSRDNENSILWVLKKKVAAGATDQQTLVELSRGDIMKKLKILQESPPYPRHILSVREGLSPGLVARIRNILTKMHEVPEGRKALVAFQNTERFDEIPGGAEELRRKLLEEIRLIHSEVGLP